jgi:Zn-dependent peptidase ImmA (M78 family)
MATELTDGDGAAGSLLHFNGKTSFDVVRPFLESAPVHLDGIANALGLVVVDVDTFERDESGRISRIYEDNRIDYVIEINSHHSKNRRRFTLAHEISHYLLHRDEIGDGITDDMAYRSRLGDHIETEANRLAAELLMPRMLVRTFFRSGIQSLDQLCQMFKVSEAAMRIRLKQLRLDA